MRTKVFFSNVASIEEVRPDGANLFPNVAIAEGANHREKLAHALQTLTDVPAVDSVVIFPDAEDPPVPLDSLRRLSCGKRIKIDTNPENILLDPSWVQRDTERYLKTRLAQLTVNGQTTLDGFGQPMNAVSMNPFMLSGPGSMKISAATYNDRAIDDVYAQDIEALTAYYTLASAGVAQQTAARLIRSSLSYSPLYGSSTADNGYINCHIDDEASFDARLIHVGMGSGTVLFNAADFEIKPATRNGMAVYHPHLIHDYIDCLTIPTGSSVVIREPSAAMLNEGRMPSVHSHGIGRDDGQPEERLVERHDLELL
jgi:hypothetical protein